jgi:hypothetical protein
LQELQTAGLAFGGFVGGAGVTNATEEYDGSAWTAGGNLGTARQCFSRLQALKQQAAAFGTGNGPSKCSNRRIRWFFLDS